jgi:hypothetical protein
LFGRRRIIRVQTVAPSTHEQMRRKRAPGTPRAPRTPLKREIFQGKTFRFVLGSDLQMGIAFSQG